MRRPTIIVVVVLAAVAFAAGYLIAPSAGGGGGGGGGEREVLYYVDPMNPSFRSPEPGTAPCGMALEPVYADGEGATGGADQRGLITVRADRQQLLECADRLEIAALLEKDLCRVELGRLLARDLVVRLILG